MKTLIALIVALFSVAAVAETLTWTPPTTRVDGTPLDPATELAPYELVCGQGDNAVTTNIPATGEAEQRYQVAKHEILPNYGEIPCYMVAVDLDGLKSEPSETVYLTWEKGAPSAVTNILIIKE
jgi:hypothetical protein